MVPTLFQPNLGKAQFMLRSGVEKTEENVIC
jgi:hypothetical protein